MYMRTIKLVSALVGAGLLAGCLGTAPVIGDQGAKTVATGSAGGENAQNANAQLEKCDKTLGTISVVEDTADSWFEIFTRDYKMQSTTPLIRLIIQQSNCFAIVERGKAFKSMERERDLMKSGEIRANSNIKKGQMVAADYTINPSITFSERGTGGGGLALGGGIFGAIVGLAGSMKSNEVSTMLILIDNRSGLQLAAAEGSAKNWDFGAIGGIFGGAGAGASGFSKTPQGKVLTAAFMDSYNGIVRSVREYKAQSVEGGMGRGGKLKTN